MTSDLKRRFNEAAASNAAEMTPGGVVCSCALSRFNEAAASNAAEIEDVDLMPALLWRVLQ